MFLTDHAAPRRRRRRLFWTGSAPPPPTEIDRRAAADTTTSAHSSKLSYHLRLANCHGGLVYTVVNERAFTGAKRHCMLKPIVIPADQNITELASYIVYINMRVL